MLVFLQVVLVANSLPALNDVTAMEIPEIVAEAAKVPLRIYLYEHQELSSYYH